jgi:hypothetical protein
MDLSGQLRAGRCRQTEKANVGLGTGGRPPAGAMGPGLRCIAGLGTVQKQLRHLGGGRPARQTGQRPVPRSRTYRLFLNRRLAPVMDPEGGVRKGRCRRHDHKGYVCIRCWSDRDAHRGSAASAAVPDAALPPPSLESSARPGEAQRARWSPHYSVAARRRSHGHRSGLQIWNCWPPAGRARRA